MRQNLLLVEISFLLDNNESLKLFVYLCICTYILRQMEAKGGLTYQSADRTVHQLSHDSLPPPLSLQSFQAENQAGK